MAERPEEARMLQDLGTATPARFSVGGVQGTRVLIAHADIDARHRMRRALDDVGCVTAEVADASDLVHASWRHRPEVLLLDAGLEPGEDPSWALRRIKGDEDLAGIAVVLVGVPEGVPDALEAIEHGAHDVLAARPGSAELVARVRSARRSHDLHEQLLSRERALERLAYLDELTGLPNRRWLMRQLGSLRSRALRHGLELAVLMIDVDHFKALNDARGHQAGDLALRAVAGRLRERVRREDVIGRLGGEEFAVALPETDRDGATALAEDLRGAVAERPVRAGGEAVALTVSIGVAVWEGEPLERLLSRADRALYAAKEAGRDRVALAPPADPPAPRFSR